MICKIAAISHTSSALNYCEKGGELIFSQYCSGNADQIHRDFKNLQDMNVHTNHKSIHAILSFNPKDREMSTQELIDISEGYAKKQEFGENQYAVYLHQEKDHTHLHIVANRIGYDLTASSTSLNYKKNTQFTRTMEEEYGLIPTNRWEKDKPFIPDNTRAQSLKQVLDTCIASSNNLDEFCDRVRNNGIQVFLGRGITFIDQDKSKFKGSIIGREYSLKGIEKQIQTKGLGVTRKTAQTKAQNVAIEQTAQETIILQSNSNSANLSENNGSMNSDIDDIINSGKKKNKGRDGM